MKLPKAKMWQGQDLAGGWEVTLKLDGVQVIYKDGAPLSRAGHPLYNLPEMPDGIYEVYDYDWETTVSLVRTRSSKTRIDSSRLYSLFPAVDPRLRAPTLLNPSSDKIKEVFAAAKTLGYEGLVLRGESEWFKVKDRETHDVKITGIEEGKGKYIGKLGAFITAMGKVGTGLLDNDRSLYWTKEVIGSTIEVACMGLTPNGKFRHPRFIRFRWDK